MVINDSCRTCVPNFSTAVIIHPSQTLANWALRCKCILIITLVWALFCHFFISSLYCAMYYSSMLLWSSYNYIFSYACISHTMLGFFFYTFQSQVHNTIWSSFLLYKCISRNDTKKNLLPWRNTIKKVCSICFVANIAHLAGNFLSYVYWYVHLFESSPYGDSNITVWLQTIRRNCEVYKLYSYQS